MPRTGNDAKLGRRQDAAPQDGLHVAGVDGNFSEPVEGDHPRCPSCQVLHANPIPVIRWDEGTLTYEDYMCRRCTLDFERAEEASRKKAERDRR